MLWLEPAAFGQNPLCLRCRLSPLQTTRMAEVLEGDWSVIQPHDIANCDAEGMEIEEAFVVGERGAASDFWKND